MGKPNKDKVLWTPEKVAQEQPNIMARVDGRMYLAIVDSVNPANNTAMIQYSPQPGVKITYQTVLASVIGALNNGQALYHISEQEDCEEITQELIKSVNDKDAAARRLGSPK
jgi:hypothetical protein